MEVCWVELLNYWNFLWRNYFFGFYVLFYIVKCGKYWVSDGRVGLEERAWVLVVVVFWIIVFRSLVVENWNVGCKLEVMYVFERVFFIFFVWDGDSIILGFVGRLKVLNSMCNLECSIFNFMKFWIY